MSDAQPDPRRKPSKNENLVRAARYLGPYRRWVVISIVCAFLVGFIFTSGLGAMLPILRVLVNDDLIQAWVDRHVVEGRAGLTLVEDPGKLQLLRVKPDSLAEKAGLKTGDEIVDTDRFALVDPYTLPGNWNKVQHELASPKWTEARVTLSDGREVMLPMQEVPRALVWARRAVWFLPTNPVAAIAAVFGFIAVLAVVGNVVRFFQEHLSDRAAIHAVNDIRRRMYDHVLHIPMAYWGQKGTSDITSRLVQDAAGLQDGFKVLLGQAIQEPIKAAMALGLALYLDWRLTLIIIVFAPLMAAVIKKFGKKMRRSMRAALAKSAHMLGQIESTLVGIRVVKGANAERFERRRYKGIMSQLVTEQVKMSRYEALATPAMETIALLVVGCILLLAAWLMFSPPPWLEPLDRSKFFLVMGCLVGIGESLRRVSKLNNVLQRSNAAAGRIFETMDVPIERPRELVAGDGRARRVLRPVRQDIRFEHLTFAYPGASMNAVQDVSLTVPRGQSVAIVGRNGSGKTTLLALLPRFYDPSAGRITIDGVDITKVTLTSLRRQISVVTQDSVIFPGTIAENIAYGHPAAARLGEKTDDVRAVRQQIEQAARKAFAHDFIMEKSQGYDTPLDGLGGNLSGGQKQRLNIARAILRRSPILILDEATSQVDAESEHLIQQAIDRLIHERSDPRTDDAPTTFIIAHRFATIRSADTIVVMDKGRIVGQGQHEDLLRTCEVYHHLYERQLLAAPV